MKKIITTLLVLVLFISVASITLGAETVRTSKTTVKGKAVTYVAVSATDPTLVGRTVLAGGALGKTAPLSTMATSLANSNTEVVAAINGTFFAAYSESGKRNPYGTLKINGQYLIVDDAATLAFTSEGPKIAFAKPKMEVMVYQSGKSNTEDWPWKLENVNSLYSTEVGSCLFTPAFGANTAPHNMTSIVVRKGIITEMKKGQAPIYSDGYTIAASNAFALEFVFKVGKKIDLSISWLDQDNKPLGAAWDNASHMIGVGPTLVRNGVVIANPAAEGFTEGKITTDSGQRSFIGLNTNKELVMGTVPGVTIKQLAEITKEMGLTDAINLDGGASSGLYFGGKYLTSPGRDLSNCIVIVRTKGTPAPTTPAVTTKPAPTNIPSTWAKPLVEEAINKGIVPGHLQDHYTKQITRLQFCQIMAAVLEKRGVSFPAPPAQSPFPDTNDPQVLKLSQMGIINGYTDGRFAPDELLNRGTAAVLLTRVSELGLQIPFTGTPQNFNDSGSIPAWCQESVAAASAAGILTGDEKGNYNSEKGFTLEQAIITALRLFNYQG